MLFTGTFSVQSKEVQMKEAIMLSLNHVPKTSMVDCKKKKKKRMHWPVQQHQNILKTIEDN